MGLNEGGLTPVAAATSTAHVLAPVAGGTNLINGTASNGTDTGVNTRQVFTSFGESSYEFAYANLNIGSNGEVTGSPTNTLAPIATLEYPTGKFTPITFSGGQLLAARPLNAYTFAWSDPIDIYIPAGTQYVVHTYLAVTAGQTWYTSGYAEGGATATGGTSETDKTTTSALSGSYNRPYGCVGVRSRDVAGTTLRIAGFGDSIVAANGDSTGNGWFGRAFANYRRLRLGQSGEKASALPDQNAARRLSLSYGCNACFVCYGTNDVNAATAAATIEANLTTGWRGRAARGMKVYTATLPPITTSTDSFATLANQTINANDAIRIAVNTWIRGGAPIDPTTKAPVAVGTSGALVIGDGRHPVARYYEFADTVESARDSGKWAVSGAANFMTADGTHPSDTGHTNMAATITPAVILADVGVSS